MIFVLETLVQISARTVAILTEIFFLFSSDPLHTVGGISIQVIIFFLGSLAFLSLSSCHLILLTLKHTMFQRILNCFHLKVNG